MSLCKIGVAGLALLVNGAAAQASLWGQCGGQGWAGPSLCVGDSHCVSVNPYYYQCTPGAASGTTMAATTTTTSIPATTSTPVTTSSPGGPGSSSSSPPPTTTHAVSVPTGSGTNPGATLLSGWNWIRAVETPYSHSYLQSRPTGLASDAYLADPSGAGQFNVVDGQLVYNTGAGGDLYMQVAQPADAADPPRTLETWFATETSAYGSFSFSGDTLEWAAADLDRPNDAAFLVCGDDELYVNTGAYLYETPTNCSDQTIHSYGGSTASV